MSAAPPAGSCARHGLEWCPAPEHMRALIRLQHWDGAVPMQGVRAPARDCTPSQAAGPGSLTCRHPGRRCTHAPAHCAVRLQLMTPRSLSTSITECRRATHCMCMSQARHISLLGRCHINTESMMSIQCDSTCRARNVCSSEHLGEGEEVDHVGRGGAEVRFAAVRENLCAGST